MAVALTVAGGILILAGLVLLFGRGRDESGEMKFKFKDFELASTRPSIVLIVVGAALAIVPQVYKGPAETIAPSPQVPFESVMSPSATLGTTCCIAGGSCPMTLGAAPVGSPCFCMSIAGDMAQGTTCQ